MYKIGEFSKITKISSRMLRYYDQEDLLKPSFVDTNGYRFYGDDDLKIIQQIKHLRKYGVSYSEIKTIFANDQFDDKSIYSEKLEILKQTRSNYETLISELEAAVEEPSRTGFINPYDVQHGHKSSFSALCKSTVVDENQLDAFIEHCLQELSTPDLICYGDYQVMFNDLQTLNEGQVAVQFVQPIVEPIEVAGFQLLSFEEGAYIGTIHYGPYETLGQAYSCLYRWANQNGYEVGGQFTEKYYVDAHLTSDAKAWITDVSVKVIKTD